MDRGTLCLLCVNICKEYRKLYDESGSSNDVYETTVKYFDPILLNLEREKAVTVICVECWRHIDDFNTFQLSVILAQTKLNEYTSQIDTVVKTEDEICIDPMLEFSENPVPDSCTVKSDDDKPIDEDDKGFIGFPDIEEFDELNDYDFSSEDEKPLLECMKSTRKRRAKATAPKKKDPQKEKLAITKVAKKRGRKPKAEKLEKQQKTKVKNKKENVSRGKTDGVLTENSLTEENQIPSNEESNGGDKVQERHERTSKEIDDFIATWKQDLDCYLCTGTAPNMFALRQHFRKEHPNKRCYVLCCQRKLSRRHQLEEHIRVHIDPGAFKCQQCGKCCTNKRTLSNHMYEQHTEQGQTRSFECSICHKCFAKKTVWKRHMEIHEPSKDHICKECGKGFPTEQRRNVHQRMVHNVERICDQCGKIFRGIYSLRIHLQEHAGVERRKWACDQCSARLNTHASLKRHKLVAHNDGSTIYICSECGKVSPSAIALLSHKKYVHQAPRKYKCTICDKAFKTNLVLREHMAGHTGEDLYTCPHCPKTFKVSSNMHHHRKKAHPIEWAEAKLRKPMTATSDINQVLHEIVM